MVSFQKIQWLIYFSLKTCKKSKTINNIFIQHITKMYSVYILLCIRPYAKAGRYNGQQGGHGSCPHKFSKMQTFRPDPFIFPPRASVGYRYSTWDTGGLSKPGSSEPEACSVVQHWSDDRRILEDCTVHLSDGNSTGQNQVCSNTELSLTSMGLQSTQQKHVISQELQKS